VTPRVIASLVHQLADLHAWGKDARGWWALISWSTYGVLDAGHNGHVHCSAWVPADTVQRSADPMLATEYRSIERFELPPDPAAWPILACRLNESWHHFGAITAHPGEIPGIRGILGKIDLPADPAAGG
jgi:hypothetical protein